MDDSSTMVDVPTPDKYNAVTQAFHWLTAALVIAAFVLGPEDLDDMENPGLDLGFQTHASLGMIVLILTAFRLLWVYFSQPEVVVRISSAMAFGAKLVQGVLYLLLFTVPLTALLGIWLEGDALMLLRNVAIVSPLPLKEAAGEALLDLHPVLANTLMWLAGAHALAALFHHYVMKDAVLRSMLPK